MRRVVLSTLVIALAACGAPEPAAIHDTPPPIAVASPPARASFAQYWVTSERLARRTCASSRCGVVGQLMFRESAQVYEMVDGWARITEPYDASCAEGRSDYVDSG